MAPQTNWRVPEITRKGDISSQVAPPPFKMVMEEGNVLHIQPLSPLNMVCNCLQMHQKKAGALKQSHGKGNLVPYRKKATHKLPGTKGSLLDPKRVQHPCRKNSSYSHRQHHSDCLYKQGRGMKSGPLCALLLRILTCCTSRQITLKARHIPGCLNVVADKLSRLGQAIQTEWSLLPEVFQAMCNRCQQPQIDLLR